MWERCQLAPGAPRVLLKRPINNLPTGKEITCRNAAKVVKQALIENNEVSESLKKTLSITAEANTCQRWSWHQCSGFTM